MGKTDRLLAQHLRADLGGSGRQTGSRRREAEHIVTVIERMNLLPSVLRAAPTPSSLHERPPAKSTLAREQFREDRPPALSAAQTRLTERGTISGTA